MNVSIQPNKSADFIDNCSSIIQMKVVTTALFSSDLIMKLSIGIISAVVAFTLTITIYCCYRRWKKRRAS
jgi:D-serine dehydratase